MTRYVALHAGALFMLVTLILGALGGLSPSALVEAAVILTGLLCILMLGFASVAPVMLPSRTHQRRSSPG